MSDFQSQSQLGVGLGLRRECHRQTIAARAQIDFLEIIPENYMRKGGRAKAMLVEALEAGFPVVSHGVNLSIGSTDPLNLDYIDALKDLFSWVKPVWFSDHLCFTSVGGQYFNDLIPLPPTWEAVEHVVKRVKALQAQFEMPFCLENISYYTHFETGELTEAQFISEIVEQADCGLLLDVNNVYVNAQNHGYDPLAFIQQLPVERVLQIHMAGHLRTPELIIDTHGEAVCDEVITLFAQALPLLPNVKGVLLERDSNIPAFDDLLIELETLRCIAQPYFKKALPV